MDARAHRNLHPHKAARYAMHFYSDRYAKQGGGSMDFWDSLTERERQECRERVADLLRFPDEILLAPDENR